MISNKTVSLSFKFLLKICRWTEHQSKEKKVQCQCTIVLHKAQWSSSSACGTSIAGACTCCTSCAGTSASPRGQWIPMRFDFVWFCTRLYRSFRFASTPRHSQFLRHLLQHHRLWDLQPCLQFQHDTRKWIFFFSNSIALGFNVASPTCVRLDQLLLYLHLHQHLHQSQSPLLLLRQFWPDLRRQLVAEIGKILQMCRKKMLDDQVPLGSPAPPIVCRVRHHFWNGWITGQCLLN